MVICHFFIVTTVPPTTEVRRVVRVQLVRPVVHLRL
jgi:hypothetical protein